LYLLVLFEFEKRVFKRKGRIRKWQ